MLVIGAGAQIEYCISTLGPAPAVVVCTELGRAQKLGAALRFGELWVECLWHGHEGFSGLVVVPGTFGRGNWELVRVWNVLIVAQRRVLRTGQVGLIAMGGIMLPREGHVASIHTAYSRVDVFQLEL